LISSGLSQSGVVNSNVNEVTISEIQFTTDAAGGSPLVGNTVTTSGVVTAIRPGDGYFIQDGSGPWNGIYVFSTTNVPNPGDLVRITANVSEYFGMTQLSSISSFEALSTGNPLPDFTIITSAQVNTEAYEAVLVRVENAVCTNANAGFGMWEINNGTGPAKVDDDIFSFTPTLGTAYNVQGPVFYSFSEFKILPRFSADVQVYVASINELENNQFTVYPNPSTGMYTIQVNQPTNAAMISVTNMLGQQIFTSELTQTSLTISLEGEPQGVYFITLTNGTTRSTQRVILN
jgi:predicted extracellular nuclease